jgi:hypothetical protein
VPFVTPSGGASENHPDDGRQTLAICQEKTTETDGGHLGTAQGLIGVSKGFWITMARLAGWSGASSSSTCDVNSDGSTDALDLQRLANVILGVNSGSGDLNHDGRTDALDLQVLANVVLGMASCP